ncbi:hypothetical protein D3C85_891930 [compost metagenome]
MNLTEKCDNEVQVKKVLSVPVSELVLKALYPSCPCLTSSAGYESEINDFRYVLSRTS